MAIGFLINLHLFPERLIPEKKEQYSDWWINYWGNQPDMIEIRRLWGILFEIAEYSDYRSLSELDKPPKVVNY